MIEQFFDGADAPLAVDRPAVRSTPWTRRVPPRAGAPVLVVLALVVAVFAVLHEDSAGAVGAREPAAVSALLQPAALPAPLAAMQTTSPRPPRPAPAVNEALAERMEALMDEVEGVDVAVVVTVGDGGEVFSVGGDRPVLPASTQKLVTAAAALEILGPDHRYITEVQGPAPDEHGIVHGNLTLVGAGDPTLGTKHYGHLIPGRPRTPMESLVEDVVASGVHRVTGTVVPDASAWAHEPAPKGWPQRYFSSGEVSYVSALTVDAGRQILRGASSPVADPARHAAAVFAGMLAERGVVIDAAPTRSDDSTQATVRVGAVASVPLAQMLAYTVQASDNHLADGIFRSVGAAVGDATWKGSAKAAAEVLEGLGVDTTDLVLDDGSGLSRTNQVPVTALAMLDAAMTARHEGWSSLHAVSGRSGTLRSRLVGTPAEGKVRAKTGTLNDVRALAGSVDGPNGGRYHFAVVGNGLDGAGVQATRALQDRVAVILNQALIGCAAAEHAADRACKD